MASATNPDKTKAPPPYTAYDEKNTGISYQQHVSPPIHPAYFAPQSPSPARVYIQPATIHSSIGTAYLGNNSVGIRCPQCQQQIITVVRHVPGGGTWLFILLICLFGGFFGCCLIPLCIPACQDVIHTCPACGSFIGRRNTL